MIFALAPILAAALVQQPPTGSPADGPRREIGFRCHVAEGPALRDCQVRDPAGVDPGNVEVVRKVLEHLPSCVLGQFKPGTDVDRPFVVYDSPAYFAELARMPAIITQPDWAERPDPQIISKVYPLAAAQSGLAGRAVIACDITAEGHPTNCQVQDETPPGHGFGAAALRAVAQFHLRPQTRDCVPTDTGRMIIPIVFGGR
ncbi:energy transducer TonB [Phenylobacterium sp.]|uniref:energy transducer TonB n=1 Tax=Phenylobacterium sp. TaxID=1871053 RepID=UPI002DE34F8D|nr:energy transducer TonB [Phenylobacterium sp.]